MPFPEPQVLGEWSILYGVEDVIRCHEQGGEPRVSGRRVRDAMEIEIGLRESHRAGNMKVALPLGGPLARHGVRLVSLGERGPTPNPLLKGKGLNWVLAPLWPPPLCRGTWIPAFAGMAGRVVRRKGGRRW